jgi:hypothetical protein
LLLQQLSNSATQQAFKLKPEKAKSKVSGKIISGISVVGASALAIIGGIIWYISRPKNPEVPQPVVVDVPQPVVVDVSQPVVVDVPLGCDKYGFENITPTDPKAEFIKKLNDLILKLREIKNIFSQDKDVTNLCFKDTLRNILKHSIISFLNQYQAERNNFVDNFRTHISVCNVGKVFTRDQVIREIDRAISVVERYINIVNDNPLPKLRPNFFGGRLKCRDSVSTELKNDAIKYFLANI